MNFSKPEIEVAAAILIVDDKIWIQKRKNVDHLMGYWEFPGGKLQSNELPTQALVRELQEELGIAIEEPSKHSFLTQDYVYSKRKVKIHFFIVPFNHQFSGKGRWVSPEQLPEYNFPPANKLVLEKIRHLS